MAKIADLEPTYVILSKVADSMFRSFDSLFTPGSKIWESTVCDDLYVRFVENPDESSRSFLEKFKDQLQDAPSATVQLAAEMLYVQLIPPSGIGRRHKIKTVEDVLSWCGNPVDFPAEMKEAFERGIANDMAFMLQRPFHLAFLLELMRKWHATGEPERQRVLGDPWTFKAYLQDVPVKAAQPMREMLYHFVFPESFEPISSRKQKKLIRDAFQSRLASVSGDVDKDLLEIRRSLTAEHSRSISFYEPAIVHRWKPDLAVPDESRRDCFLAWLQQCASSDSVEEIEIKHKMHIADRLRTAREEFIANDANWPQSLKQAIGPPNNLTYWRMNDQVRKLATNDPQRLATWLHPLWSNQYESEGDRMRAFTDAVNHDAFKRSSAKAALMSFLLMGVDAERFPIHRVEAFKKAYKLSGYSKLPPSADTVQKYQFALKFLDELIEASQTWDTPLKNRLVAQSALWILCQWENAPEDLSQETWQQLQRFRNGELLFPGGSGEPSEDEADEEDDESNLEALADSLLLNLDYLERLERLLDDKRQIVIYGPPGTGKTYVAQKFAQYLTGASERVTIVQFHPSYTYEDFFEGFRPALVDGNTVFKLHDGPLKRLTTAAAENPNETFVLVVDEINRGNLAKVFGELYFLLEYRNHSINLQYSNTPFRLPDNLRIIGTMNTADRSIAPIDAALRRRFYFVEFFPDRPPVKGLLRRWLQRHQPDMEWVANAVDAANSRLEDRHLTIGPSHFMKTGLDEDWVNMIWSHSVLPYLEEHFFGQPDRIDTFTLDRIRADLHATLASPEGPDGANPSP